MYKIGLKYALSASLAGMVFSAYAITIPPELTLTALTEPSLAIPKGEVGSIQYKLMNHSDKAHHLTMKAIPGVRQLVANKDSCGEGDINLAPGKTCILSLQVSANETIGLNKTGPLLCEDLENGAGQEALASTQCIEPNIQERISVREIPADKGSISVKVKLPQKKSKVGFVDEHFKRCFSSFAGCTLTMFQDSDVIGDLAITNTSSTVVIRNLQANEDDLPAGVIQDYSDCEYLAPGDTCDLIFYPGSSTTLGTSVGISGSNTGTSYVTFEVLGIGDPYNGANLLIQLPTEADLNYYTVSPGEVSSMPTTWAVADAACTGNDELPAIEQVVEMYDASNCNLGLINGFSCADLYWSSTSNSPGFVEIINFTDGSQASFSVAGAGLARCVQAYVIV